MRTSTTILEKIERLLTSPRWTYCAMWHFPPFAPPRLPTRPGERTRPGSEVRR